MGKILVTGGAGYIGSHTSLALTQAGYEVIVYDNLSTGRVDAVLPPARLVVGDLKDRDKLDKLMREEKFQAIIHFAASIVVPESVENPLKYYLNNTSNTTSLIALAVKNNIPNFVFSSTAAVYGMPEKVPVNEQSPLMPINPYGRSKVMSEWVIRDASFAHPDFNFIILRYFNVAGADPLGRIGQSTPDATHLIKVACQAALGLRESLSIFGTDYPTPDGTGIRDYIHVVDLADVHVLALKFLEQGKPSGIYNCGYGHGYSVREIIDAVKKVSGVDFKVIETGRRPGDPAQLVADPGKLLNEMNWKPKYDDIEEIVRTAYNWEKKLRG
ncbi:UDP-glucose 4-epimerase GalE [Desulfohalobiaceae bacterium Ax17]|jgi:UDP-glucose 4-epimerase|uniref:UDP-glucose 4-epimerase GalE n=1 Tax=Desulfovulcanus ferrireducens TaxID=2831190 RepID=UPI00207BAB2B|nr:UDP-glucose 4-epimerase GalE [Desulfovulcanus ferrireducens]MBT8764057.1 UDP-glucose 4-epimerase GalE [Desulfovulcanus ferrireducens]